VPAHETLHRSEEGDIKKAYVLYGVLLAASALVFLTPSDEEDFLARILIFDAIMVVTVVVMVSLSWETIARALPGPFRLLHLGTAAAVAVCTFAAAALYSLVWVPLLPEDLPNIVDMLIQTGLPKWKQLAIIAVYPAVVEELAFRGLILPFLTSRMPVVHAVIVSSAAFAILHMDWLFLPFLFGLGLVLGWLRVASGSLIPPMLVHFFHNGAIWLAETLT
jgi:membrane protease YdiL (CAAX protease family)